MNDNEMSLSAQIELALCTIAAPGKLNEGCKAIERIVEEALARAGEHFDAKIDKFVADTDALATTKERDANVDGISERLAQYREGTAYGLSLAATRALRMKVGE